MNILIVDDHESNRYLIEAIFKRRGHTMRSAPNGAVALDVLKAEPVDLIISDILMPVMDGFQLCRKVKGDEALRAIPFIIYTATYTGTQDQAFALKVGADRFLEKPCEPDLLIATVDELIESARRGGSAEPVPQLPEAEALQLYSERLVRKLEQKVLEVEVELKARQVAEEAFRESERRLVDAQRMARMGDFTWDVETGEITWSKALYEMMGFDSSQPLDLALVEEQLHHPEDQPRIAEWLRAAIESEGSELPPNEYRIRRRDGSVMHVRVLGTLQRPPGRKPKIFATIQDITDRKLAELEREKLQGELYQSQKMESVGRLAGGVAHDLNNMLSVVLGFAELSLDQLAPDDPVRQNLDEIQQAALRSTEVTRQLLAFARKQTIAPQVLDLNESIDGMRKMLRRLIREDINLVWRPGNRHWQVRMDPSQVDQILVNLYLNARDAIPGHGTITLETGTASISDAGARTRPGAHAGDFVWLKVHDDGCGMSPEVMEKIFEPFFTTKELGKGTGLGLSTVYGIVKQNEGFIEVASQPGRGSSMTVFLPRHVGEPSSPLNPKLMQPSMGSGETILLVEDEVAILKIAKALLERMGYRVLASSNPIEALDIAKVHAAEIQLMITDVIMPDLNGRDLARAVELFIPSVRVLFISGYGADVLADQDLLPSGRNFLQKPFSVELLASKVKGMLTGG